MHCLTCVCMAPLSCQIPFEDVMIPFDAFKKLKMMEKFPFGQVSVMSSRCRCIWAPQAFGADV